MQTDPDVITPTLLEDSPDSPTQNLEAAALFRKRRNENQDGVDWKSVAARLQADMVNFRKRQEGLASDEIMREKQRLLREFLTIVDRFEAILAHVDSSDALHAGVQMAYDAMMILLQREGVEVMDGAGMAFNPSLHEAVAQVNTDDPAIAEPTIIEVTQAGYMMGEMLLRPAQVVVAVPQA